MMTTMTGGWQLSRSALQALGDRLRAPAPSETPAWATSYRSGDFPRWAYTADTVGIAADAETGALEALLVVRGREPFAGADAWPGGFVEQRSDADARAAVLRELREETGPGGVRYLEALDTYDAAGRDPRQFAGHSDPATGAWVDAGARVVSKAFLAVLHRSERDLVPEPGEDAAEARWVDVYAFLPWEDHRADEGRLLAAALARALGDWARAAPASERARRALVVDRAFGAAGAEWNEERAPERYRLLLEAGLVAEAWRDRWGQLRPDVPADSLAPGRAMAFDHRQMLADALGRLRGKIKYAPGVLAALAGRETTLPALQRVLEGVAGRWLATANFRRTMTTSRPRAGAGRLLEAVEGERAARTRPGPRPVVYAFGADVDAERLDVAIRYPWAGAARRRGTEPAP